MMSIFMVAMMGFQYERDGQVQATASQLQQKYNWASAQMCGGRRINPASMQL